MRTSIFGILNRRTVSTRFLCSFVSFQDYRLITSINRFVLTWFTYGNSSVPGQLEYCALPHMKIRSLAVQGPYERAVFGPFESEGINCAELRLSCGAFAAFTSL